MPRASRETVDRKTKARGKQATALVLDVGGECDIAEHAAFKEAAGRRLSMGQTVVWTESRDREKGVLCVGLSEQNGLHLR